jgi:peptidoglycan hydrolase-like protein with peptidoglycan-binding domain
MTGPDVTRLQHELFNQGFTYVHATGTYDYNTYRAVSQFQHDRGITADPQGVYGPTTRAALEGAG